MMRSLYSGVSGLKVHQTKMDVIGNNIANVNTVGFKSSKVTFSELFYQTTQNASGPNAETGTGGQNAQQIGLGATLGSISTQITNEGGNQSTGNALDLKINGSSFFVVQSGGSNYFTKAGNFTTDALGNLVTGSGAYVMGYTASRNEATGDYELQKDELRPISLYGSEYSYTAPAQTTQTTFSGNINSEDDEFSTSGSGQITRIVYAYDNLGHQYGVQVAFKKVSNSEYTVEATGKVFNGNNAVDSDALTASFENSPISLIYDSAKGNFIGDTGSFDLTLSGTDATGYTSPITVDFSKTTAYASDTTVDSKKGGADGTTGAGKAVGTMTEVGIDTYGRVVASYSNGDNAVIGQLAVATFENPSGLEKVGQNMFAATMNSGEFNGVGQEIAATGGSFSTGVLEMSNVDLASEFTDMIVTQRGFQANSRIITTSDTMIEELLSLKR